MSKTSSEVKRRYNEKAYDRIGVTVPKGRKADIEAAAATRGASVNALVNDLLRGVIGLSEDEWKKPNGGENQATDE